MKTQIFLIPVILSFLFFSNSYSQSSYSFSDGLSTAKSSGKMIFLDIFSPADNWSKKMDSEVFSSADVKSALSDFVFIKLDANGESKYNYGKKEYSSGELAKQFGGTGYPTFVFMNSDGSVISFKYNGESASSVSGFIGADDFVEMLDFFKQGKYRDTDLSVIFSN
jgi:thioredoxin-related protein